MITSYRPLIIEHTRITKKLYNLVKCRIRWEEKLKLARRNGDSAKVRHYYAMIDIDESGIIFVCRILGIDHDDLITQATAAYLKGCRDVVELGTWKDIAIDLYGEKARVLLAN